MKKILTILTLAITILMALPQFPVSAAYPNPPTLTELNSAISRAEAYEDRMYYYIDANWGAVSKEYPALPFSALFKNQGVYAHPGYPHDNAEVEIEVISTTNFKYRFKYGGTTRMAIEVCYEGYDATKMKLSWKQYLYDASYPTALYIGDTLLVDGKDPYFGSWNHIYKEYGWASHRYTNRHNTNLLANEYEVRAKTQESLLNQFSDKTFVGRDLYDAIWFKGSGDKDDNWLYKFDLYMDACQANWDLKPKGRYYYPYRSKVERDLGLYVGQVSPYDPLSRANKATWLLNKYGTSRKDEAKSLIDACGWDGHGVSKTVYVYGTIPYTMPVYSGIRTAVYLAAVTRYAQITGEQWAKDRADQVASVLVDIQWLGNDWTYEYGQVNRPDYMGGFMVGYEYDPVDNRHEWKEMKVDETIKWLMDLLGYGDYLSPEYYGQIMVNSETTYVATQALRIYRKFRYGTTLRIVQDDFDSNYVDIWFATAPPTLYDGGTTTYGRVRVPEALYFKYYDAWTTPITLTNPTVKIKMWERGHAFTYFGWAHVKVWLGIWGNGISYQSNVVIYTVGWFSGWDAYRYLEVTFTPSLTLQSGVTYTIEVGISFEGQGGAYIHYYDPDLGGRVQRGFWLGQHSTIAGYPFSRDITNW